MEVSINEVKSAENEIITNKITSKPRGVSCTKKYIHLIRSGEKTIEGRVAAPIYKNIKAGDKLRFFYRTNAQDDVVCLVNRVSKYTTFKEMLIAEGVSNCIPGTSNLEKALKVYQTFPKYREKELKYGVLAFKLQLQ